ncbi:MAG TPA: hypothetical protein VEC11_10500 [Allosphingosinicella sp.]|nr:hypothetical protein [Allosphingosinicella sp.]
MTEKKKPEVIEDNALEDASGGLPAIQKVRESANRSSGATNTYTGTTTVNQGTLNATPTKPGDGSV